VESGRVGSDYTERLVGLQRVWWKRLLPVQAPYRWNLRRLHLGSTLDLGCGIGRNLVNLGGRGVGIDHDPQSVAVARARGLEAYSPDEFLTSSHAHAGAFDALLSAHVAEHMTPPEFVDFVHPYLRFVRDDGQVVFITPQERGFRHDPTHVQFVDFAALRDVTATLGLAVTRAYSFPFPRRLGSLFVYNEFVMVARRRSRAA
jgi:SAM-dependent methyltransferase